MIHRASPLAGPFCNMNSVGEKGDERLVAPQPQLLAEGSRKFALLTGPLRLYQHFVVVIQQIRVRYGHLYSVVGFLEVVM